MADLEDPAPKVRTRAAQHPQLRILPTFGARLLPRDDRAALAAWTEAIGVWKADLVAEGLRARTINGYLTKLSKIINDAVDLELFDRNPMHRRSGARRTPLLRDLEVDPVDVWLTIPQLQLLAEAIDERYRAMVILAGRTGLRFGECAGLLWSNLELDEDYDDGAVAGVGRLTVAQAISDPTRTGKTITTPPKTRAGRRTIAVDAATAEALKLHRKHFGDGAAGQMFTTPGGPRGSGGTLNLRNFSRVWGRALTRMAACEHLGGVLGGLHQGLSAVMRPVQQTFLVDTPPATDTLCWWRSCSD